MFRKYQLYREEGSLVYNIDQSDFVDSIEINTTHNIQEGTNYIVQKPPASSKGLSSGSLAEAS